MTQGDDDMAAVIQEVFGGCLGPHLPQQFFAVFAGRGGNEKTAATTALAAVFGRESMSGVTTDDLSENRFARFGLFGKPANVIGDQGYFNSKDEGVLKTLTGGDLVTFGQ